MKTRPKRTSKQRRPPAATKPAGEAVAGGPSAPVGPAALAELEVQLNIHAQLADAWRGFVRLTAISEQMARAAKKVKKDVEAAQQAVNDVVAAITGEPANAPLFNQAGEGERGKDSPKAEASGPEETLPIPARRDSENTRPQEASALGQPPETKGQDDEHADADEDQEE
jgi:hypothetical protein